METPKRNRGKEASDDRLFGNIKQQQKIRAAVHDMHYLLSRGYAEKSSVKLVGHHYRLNARQIMVMQGMSASKQAISLRSEKSLPAEQLLQKTVIIDGFNLLIIMESALSGAYLFEGLDGYYRDISSVHGTYKRVKKTEEALLLIGKTLQELCITKAIWYFDAPVSNSGRLKTILYELSITHNFEWEIHLDNNPDKVLAQSNHIVITSDAWILNNAMMNFNFMQYFISKNSFDIQVVSLF